MTVIQYKLINVWNVENWPQSLKENNSAPNEWLNKRQKPNKFINILFNKKEFNFKNNFNQ